MQPLFGGFIVISVGGTLYLIVHSITAQFLSGSLNMSYEEKHKEDAVNDNFE